MPSNFTLYGAKGLAPADVVRIIGPRLGVDFSLRDSSYKGGDYYLYRGDDGVEVSIEKHERDRDGMLGEPDFPQYSTLVYVNYARPEIDRELAAVDYLDLLRTEVV